MPEPPSDGPWTISELAARSGLPDSTIRYYVREGLLPAGRRVSTTRALYGGEHLRAIETVKSLREAGVAVTEIRSRAGRVTDAPSDADLARARRDDLLEAATGCFLSEGFAGTSLAMIARAASMSKTTLYHHFSSKEEIFMACAERVFHRLYAEVWPVIGQTSTPGERLRMRWEAFVQSFSDWAPMMDLVRGLAIGSPAFRAEYLQLTKTIVAPIARELSMLDTGRHEALDQDIDPEFLSYVLMGMAEAAARAVDEGRRGAMDAWPYLESVLAELIPDAVVSPTQPWPPDELGSATRL